MKKSCCLLYFLALSGLTIAQTGPAKATLDTRNNAVVGQTITIKSQFEGLPLVEPHISAHPIDNNHLLVAGMVVTDINTPYESCRLSSFVSTDGGLLWKETAHDWWGYDPWTAILPNGQTVMAWIGTSGRFKGRYPIQFFSSDDGGMTWEDSVQTLSGNHDGTKLAALGNEFYFTTVHFNHNMGADVLLYRKEGAGEFQEVAKIDGKGQRLNFCEPALLTDGTVIVPASHFLQEAWVQTYQHNPKTFSDPHIITSNPGGAKGYMRLVADTHPTSPYKDRLYFIRAMGSGKDFQGIWLNYSTDGGMTWGKDTRIDLFENTNPSKAMVASAAVNKNGVLGISWVDAQQDPEREKNDVYFALSMDGGKSFQRPVRVTDISSNPKTKENGDVANKFPGGGHYLGLAAKPDGSFQLVWSDSRSRVFELQTCRVGVVEGGG